MSASPETQIAQRRILLVGPYGVLGTGVVDAVAANPQWGVTTAARRHVPTYREHAAPPHVSVDLMDREATTKVFSTPCSSKNLDQSNQTCDSRLGKEFFTAHFKRRHRLG
jgi:hypothetical protein